MKEKVYKILSISIAIIMVFCLLRICTVLSYAAVSENQKVVSHSARWEGYPFEFTLGGKYYTIQDPQGIPTSTYQNPNFFYTHDNVKFDFISGIDIYTYILNKNLGIVLKDTVLATIYNSWTTLINVLDSNDEYLQGGLYDGSGNFLGYCLNDISGCYFVQNSTDGIDYNQDMPNNIWFHLKYWQEMNPEYPNYFTFKPISNSGIISNFSNALSWDQSLVDFFNNTMSEYDLGLPLIYTTDGYLFSNNNTETFFAYKNVQYLLNISNETTWNNVCKQYDLNIDNTELTYTKFISKFSNSGYYIDYNVIDNQNNNITSYYSIDMKNKVVNNVTSGGTRRFGISFLNYMVFNKPITIFKSSNAKSLMDNNLYYP